MIQRFKNEIEKTEIKLNLFPLIIDITKSVYQFYFKFKKIVLL
jgi:hypothetical protein